MVDQSGGDKDEDITSSGSHRLVSRSQCQEAQTRAVLQGLGRTDLVNWCHVVIGGQCGAGTWNDVNLEVWSLSRHL